MLTLTDPEHFMLSRVARGGFYDDVRGEAFDVLLSAGLAEMIDDEDGRGLGWARVRLTEEGKKKLADVGPWRPAVSV
jgi:hypothetical protein